jgi:hypothetical protein
MVSVAERVPLAAGENTMDTLQLAFTARLFPHVELIEKSLELAPVT